MTQARLPERPNLSFLKKLAKERLRSLRADNASAKLADAQLALAREYGFASWRKLAARVEEAVVANVAASMQAVDPFIASLPEHRRKHKVVQWKPLMDAAFDGDVARARRLLDGGADPNALSTTSARYRPLHRAIEFKKTQTRGPQHEAVVRLLLERGASPSLRGSYASVTALQLAAAGETRFVPTLLGRFQPLDIFHAAAVLDDQRVEALLKRDPLLAKSRDANDWTPLHYCCASAMYKLGKAEADAQLRIAKTLLSRGADVTAAYLYDKKWPIPPLYHCCGQHNNPALAELLLGAGANPCDNESVYHAADEGHGEILALIEKYADAKELTAECTKCLSTQLHWGHTRGAAWLLAHGADPNAINPRFGDNALHAAVRARRNSKVIRLLLDHGADPRKKNRDGQTALDLAKGSKIRLPNRPCPAGRDGPARSPAKTRAARRMTAVLMTRARPHGTKEAR
jgi:ankyrin repeat protein